MDRAGRILIPGRLRDRMGIRPGQDLDAAVEDGRLVLKPIGPEVSLVRKGGRLVATAKSAPRFGHDELLRAIDESREWPREG
jgi:AbrB family looped-hinge helix DNA binding protein